MNLVIIDRRYHRFTGIRANPEVLIVPLLSYFGIMKSIKHRIGISIYVVTSIGLLAALNYYNKGYVDVRMAFIWH